MVVRWLSWTWAAIGLVLSAQDHLAHTITAVALMALALAFTVLTTVWWRTNPARLSSGAMVIVELIIAAVLLIGDGYVYLDTRPQSLPWAWPAAGLIAAGVVFGRRWAVVAAIGLSMASFVGEGQNGGAGFSNWGVSASSKAGLYILTALIAGYIANRLRTAEAQISAARAREEVAVRLHDGVLQTLAVIQRRSSDTELASLARDQERDLRDYLAGTTSSQPGLTTSLREAAALFERRHGGRAEVVIADDLEEPSDRVIEALAGAVGEALQNVGKHAQADKVVVYAEPDWEEGLFVSVKDDGVGFDPEAVTMRIGLKESIVSRIESVGGRVEISSKPGRGTEVRLWAP